MMTTSPLRDPTWRALVLAVGLIALWAWKAPITDYRSDMLRMLRHGWSNCADVIVVGDSSARYGIRPEVIEEELGGYRVVNFGFLETSIASAKFMAGAEAVLDPKSSPHAIVVEVNAWNLAIEKQGRFEAETREIKRHGMPELDWSATLDLRLKTRGLCAVLWNACPWHNGFVPGYNGHLTIDTSFRDETFFEPWAWTQLREGLQFDVPQAATRIRELIAHGVQVFVYVERARPALTPLMRQRHFDPDEVERALRATGATIIPFPTDLTTVDGLHVDPASSERWSREIGKALAAALPPRRVAPIGRCPWPLESGE